MTTSDDDLIRQRTRTMQIISGALLFGLLVFLGVVFFLVEGGEQPAAKEKASSPPILSIVSIAWLVVSGTLAFLVPGIITRTFLRQLAAGRTGDSFLAKGNPHFQNASETEKLLMIRQTTLIVSQAMLEGAGFLAAIAYLVERNQIGLFVGCAAAVLMIVKFPTAGRVRDWVHFQQTALQEMR